MKDIGYKLISVIFAFSLLFLVQTVSAQDAEEEDAEVALIIKGDIPLVEIGKDTIINITFKDTGFFNWTQLMKTFNYVYMKLVWPYMFGKGVKEWLGYHSIDFYPEIEGNISGWHAWMEPSEIVRSTAGTTADLKLHVRVDKMTPSNTAIIRIKCVRRGISGNPIAVSYARIAVTARPYHFIEVLPLKSKVDVSPGSAVTIPVKITNLGNFVDTFRISVSGTDGVVGLASDQILVLNPGESQKIYVQANAPISLFDIGSLRNLRIIAYSIHQPENTFVGEVALISRGVYLPFMIILGVVIATAIAMLYIYREPLSHIGEEKKKPIERKVPPLEKKIPVEEPSKIEKIVVQPPQHKKATRKDEIMRRILREQEKQIRKFKE